MPKQKTVRRFALIEKEILYSKSWASLTNAERVIFVHLRGEFNGMNKESLKLPYSQMRGIVSHASFWRGIKGLEDAGLIDVVFRGGRPSFKDGRPKSEMNVYRLSERWRLTEKSLAEYAKEKSNRFLKKLHSDYCERLAEDESQVSK